ncbi:unnamed protein product [Paramecium octaurelia]|uniref:Uncharacterized protein n=1 Tax=Paramecium octaurelia TaxID=43137 RepID=A0A8S1TNZ8_PAROT|nr:unnamed protein product [Paramecium octaurelia]
MRMMIKSISLRVRKCCWNRIIIEQVQENSVEIENLNYAIRYAKNRKIRMSVVEIVSMKFKQAIRGQFKWDWILQFWHQITE